MASRAYDLVLRDLSCSARSRRLIAPSIRPTAISSIPITRRRGRAIRGRRAGCCRGRAWPRSRLSRACRRGDGAADRRARRERAGASSRRSLELGLNHEEQHQELILMDIKHVLSLNPLDPVYAPRRAADSATASRRCDFVEFAGGLREIGHDGRGLSPSTTRGRGTRSGLSRSVSRSRLVTCGEYLGFIADGGYRRAGALALRRLGDGAARGLGRAALLARATTAHGRSSRLPGRRALDRAEPVVPCQLLRGRRLSRAGPGKRLPTEAEWEVAAARERRCRSPAISWIAASTIRGGGAERRRLAADDRRCLGMDASPYMRLSRLSAARRRGRRIQRQVHGQSDGAARRRGGDAAGPCPPHLSQFLFRRARAGRSAASRLAEDA